MGGPQGSAGRTGSRRPQRTLAEWSKESPGEPGTHPPLCEETLALGGRGRGGSQAQLQEGALSLHEGSSQRDRDVSGG